MTYSENLFYGASPEIHRRARELRKQMTPSERLLWDALRGNSLNGFKFRRQHPVKNFIVDFYCHEIKLVIEVDGGIHQQKDQEEYDSGRTFELEELGLRIIRFRNEDVLESLETVVTQISKLTTALKSPSRGI